MSSHIAADPTARKVTTALFFFVGCPVVAAMLSAPTAAADDSAPPPGPQLVAQVAPSDQSPEIQHVTDRWDKVSVYSPSMNKVIVNDVYKAPNPGAPTFYLLPGIDGGARGGRAGEEELQGVGDGSRGRRYDLESSRRRGDDGEAKLVERE